MFAPTEIMYSPGNIISIYDNNRKLIRAVYLGGESAIWVDPTSGGVVYSNLSVFKKYGTNLHFDLKYQTSRFSEKDIVKRAVNQKWSNTVWYDNESFIRWIVNDEVPQKPWSKTVLGASVGFYFGGIFGAVIGATVGYSM